MASDRATLRERERERRRRRMARLDGMRETVAALEAAVPVVLTLHGDDDEEDDDDNILWEDLLGTKAARVRQLMRRTIVLTKEAQRLTSSRNQLKRLLHEHQVASRVLAGMVLQNNSPLDDWKADIERWEAIARKHYKPLTIEDCQELMEAALKEEQAYQWSTEKQSTGVSFMGWRDSRRVDHARGAFQFQFEKAFPGYDIMDFVKLGWDTYTYAPTFYEVLIGPRARVVDGVAIGDRVRAVHHVVQEVSPNIMIVRNVEQYPDGPVDVHMVDMVCREKTERGFIQCVRSVNCPELMKAIDGPQTVWSSNAIWLVWERLDGAETGYTFRIGGSLVGNDMNYLSQWMLEGLGCVLRSERIVTGRRLITYRE